MPLPFELDHVNTWAVRDGAGWALIDTGIRTVETATAWGALFAGPLSGVVERVFATHMHPDHIGMAGWLTRKFGCELWMTRVEYLNCRVLAGDMGREAPEAALEFYRRAGWNEKALENYRMRFGGFGKMIYALPDRYRRLHDGEEISIGGHAWRVVVGTGHSPEHACLYCPALKLLISGDQVLPRISSNVSVFPAEPEADSLGDWLASIDKLAKEVPDDVLVLPAHNEPFRGLHARLAALRAGHERGLSRLRNVLHEPHRVVDLYRALFAREIGTNGMIMTLATGETLAHLNYLKAHGEVVAELRSDGCLWYTLAA
ncbi:MAG: MBL fold metallo-hydrolase [Nevskiaceae bacterium]|nr:MAG: MBL fold metallo-hydrolase [Nevskiaceae bacterium]TBR71585.1 MAG: MBL fold metallo-hydrolase [Nevskiaceae bacterium]